MLREFIIILELLGEKKRSYRSYRLFFTLVLLTFRKKMEKNEKKEKKLAMNHFLYCPVTIKIFTNYQKILTQRTKFSFFKIILIFYCVQDRLTQKHDFVSFNGSKCCVSIPWKRHNICQPSPISIE